MMVYKRSVSVFEARQVPSVEDELFEVAEWCYGTSILVGFEPTTNEPIRGVRLKDGTVATPGSYIVNYGPFFRAYHAEEFNQRFVKEGNLVKHALRELVDLDEPAMAKSMADAVRMFSAYGHSGGSVGYAINTIAALLNFENLSPITSDPAEWVKHGLAQWDGANPIWQNRRNPRIFSTDGGQTHYNLDKANVVLTSEPMKSEDE